MTYQSGIRRVMPDWQLYEPLRNLTILTSAMAYAMTGLSNPGGAAFERGHYLTIGPEQFPDTEVRMPLYGPLETALRDEKPEYISVWFHPATPEEGNWRVVSTVGQTLLYAIGPIFSAFYELQNDWLLANYSTDVQAWPSVANFSRVVRNCISHTGLLTMNKPTSPTVSWYRLSYDFSQNGRKVIGGDLGFGDLVILMFELADEMHGLGAPILAPPPSP